MRTILVTGAAGFIGYHLIKKILSDDVCVIGLDNINNYYDTNLKYGRLSDLGISKPDITENQIVSSEKYNNFRFIKTNLEDYQTLEHLFKTNPIQVIVNLAAQAGVRYSLENPKAYIDSNIVGFLNILEISRHFKLEHLVYASTRSVYGLNQKIPSSVSHNVDHPISLYAASKKSNELMAHTYSHLYGVPTTGLRFFTVYGPWGRPDMALFLFTKAILEKKPIKVFNKGNLQRDFTFVDDIVGGIYKVIQKAPKENKNWESASNNPFESSAPYKVYNIGNGSPVKLMDFIDSIEEELGIKARKEMLPMQQGDVYKTWADCSQLEKDFNYKPSTNIKEGISKFISWYKSYYQIIS